MSRKVEEPLHGTLPQLNSTHCTVLELSGVACRPACFAPAEREHCLLLFWHVRSGHSNHARVGAIMSEDPLKLRRLAASMNPKLFYLGFPLKGKLSRTAPSGSMLTGGRVCHSESCCATFNTGPPNTHHVNPLHANRMAPLSRQLLFLARSQTKTGRRDTRFAERSGLGWMLVVRVLLSLRLPFARAPATFARIPLAPIFSGR